MKILGGIIFGIGFLLIAETASSSDFYEECRAAADCVAGEPMSFARMLIQSVAGVILLGIGYDFIENDEV